MSQVLVQFPAFPGMQLRNPLKLDVRQMIFVPQPSQFFRERLIQTTFPGRPPPGSKG